MNALHDSIGAGATQSAVQVRTASTADASAWQGYVDAHASASVFHDWAWRSILTESFGFAPHYLMATRGPDVVAVLPLVEVHTWFFGHTLTSLPFCSWGGPLGSDDEAMRAIDAAAIALGDRLGVDHVEYRRIDGGQDGKPEQDLYVMFRKSITADNEANMNAIPRKQRAMVRKGIKNALACREDSVTGFYDLYVDNVHRHGTPPAPLPFFERMKAAYGDRCQVLTVDAPDGQPISTVLSLYHRNEVFPFYAGDAPRARELAANDFKYWEVMRRAADAGYTAFNYGRSKRGTGSFDFKRNWGFEPTPLHYEYHLRHDRGIPQNNPSNAKYRLIIETWRRLPRWLVRSAGPLLIRGLG